jgi:hypothetical protein
MALIAPSSARIPLDGAWVRHTPHGSAGVGRPGGIARSRPGGSSAWAIVDLDDAPYNISATPNLAGAVINAAWADHNGGSKVLLMPEGEFRLNTNVNGGAAYLWASRIILRGNGQGRTLIKGGNAFIFGNESWSSFQNVTSSPLTKGATSFEVAGDLSGQENKLMKVTWADQLDDAMIAAGAVPVFHTEVLNSGIRTTTHRVTAISGSTVSFTPPILHQPDSNITAKVQFCFFSSENDYIGLEDFTLDTEGATSFNIIGFGACYAPHIYNVGIKNFMGNYALKFDSCVRPEIRGVYVGPGVVGASNHAGMLMGTTCGALIEDCTFDEQFPAIEVNQSYCGVYAHNYNRGYLNLNHGAHNYGWLLTRNITKDGPMMFDGYFGGCEGFTFTQNWMSGGLVMRRFSWKMNIMRNISMKHGDIANPFWTWEQAQGLATMVGQWNGVSEFWATPPNFSDGWKQTCTLTNRVNDFTGEFTSNGTHRMYEGSFKVGLGQVGGGWSNYNASGYAQLMPPTTTENSMTHSGVWRLSFSEALPPVGTVFDIWGPGVASWHEHHLDTPRSAFVKGNFTLQIGAETGWPATNPINESTDTIPEYLDATPPDGSSVDAVNWGACPWYGLGNGMINPADPSAISDSSNPAGKAYTDAIASSFATSLAGTNNDLTFTAKRKNEAANSITVSYVDPGVTTATENVVVTGTNIIVNLRRSGGGVLSTAAQVMAAVNGDSNANVLVLAANAPGNNGTGAVTAMSATTLSGFDLTPVETRLNDDPTSVATPSFSPVPGAYTMPIEIVMYCPTAGAALHYTNDGSDPTAASPLYSAPLTLTNATTLKAIGIKAGLDNSPVRTGAYAKVAAVSTTPPLRSARAPLYAIIPA